MFQHLTSLVEKLVSGNSGESFSKPSPVRARKRKTSELPVPDFSDLSKEKSNESTSYSPLSNTGDSTDDIPIENFVAQSSQNETKDKNDTESEKKSTKKKGKSKKKEKKANKSTQNSEQEAPATAAVSSDSEIEGLWGENPTEALLNKSSQGMLPFH